MAITINRRANVDGDNLYEYDLKGLSTDTKPTQIGGQDIEDNSLFLELDTGDFYYLSGGTWVKVGEALTPPTPTGMVIEDTVGTIEGVYEEDVLIWYQGPVSKRYNDYYTALQTYLNDYSNLRVELSINGTVQQLTVYDITNNSEQEYIDIYFKNNDDKTGQIGVGADYGNLTLGLEFEGADSNSTIKIIEV